MSTVDAFLTVQCGLASSPVMSLLHSSTGVFWDHPPNKLFAFGSFSRSLLLVETKIGQCPTPGQMQSALDVRPSAISTCVCAEGWAGQSVKLEQSVSLSRPMSGTHLCGDGPYSQMGHQTSHLQSSPGTGLSFWQGHLFLLNTCQRPPRSVPQGCSEIDRVKVTTVKYKVETRLMNYLCRQNHLSHVSKTNSSSFHAHKQNLT